MSHKIRPAIRRVDNKTNHMLKKDKGIFELFSSLSKFLNNLNGREEEETSLLFHVDQKQFLKVSCELFS